MDEVEIVSSSALLSWHSVHKFLSFSFNVLIQEADNERKLQHLPAWLITLLNKFMKNVQSGIDYMGFFTLKIASSMCTEVIKCVYFVHTDLFPAKVQLNSQNNLTDQITTTFQKQQIKA